MLRAPDGGHGEDVEGMRAAGFEWIALNVADYPPDSWATTLSRAAAAGVIAVPKGRLGFGDDTREECLAKLELICRTAHDWGTDGAVVNVETEIKPPELGGVITPKDVALALDENELDQAAISTESWLYDMDWTSLTPYPVLLQLYPEDNRFPPEEVPEQLATRVRRARAYGFVHVGVTYQGWRSDPGWFDLTGHAWNVAYADDIGYGNFGRWS